MYKFTHRVQRLIFAAESTLRGNRSVLTPIDLFIGGLYERSGVLGELFLRGRFDVVLLEAIAQDSARDKIGTSAKFPPFEAEICSSVIDVLTKADEIRLSFSQALINEGHLFAALFHVDEINELLGYSESSITKSEILEIVSSPRDMAVSLLNYRMAPVLVHDNVTIRRAEKRDAAPLFSFVKTEFGDRWLPSLARALESATIPIFIALLNDDIVGFACYDTAQKKKGVFGPMGTSLHHCQQGVGKALLHYCLSAMQAEGYGFAIIKNAGPLEFYERSCGAIVIPKNF